MFFFEACAIQFVDFIKLKTSAYLLFNKLKYKNVL